MKDYRFSIVKIKQKRRRNQKWRDSIRRRG